MWAMARVVRAAADFEAQMARVNEALTTASDAQSGPVAPARVEMDPNATDVVSGPQIAAEASEPLPITTGGYEPTIAPCGCLDDTLDRLRDMVRARMGQMEASRAIWGVAG